jgi:hypothetical protein
MRHPGIPGGDGPFLADRFTGHQRLTQSGHGGDQRLRTITGDRVRGERHPGGRRADHRLHQDRHRRVATAVALVVRAHPLRVGGGEAQPHRLGQPVDGDVQGGLVQAGVGGARQVLGGAGRSHREPSGAQTAYRRRQVDGPPVDVNRRGGDDQTRRDGKPGRHQIAQNTGLRAHRRPIGGPGRGKLDDP